LVRARIVGDVGWERGRPVLRSLDLTLESGLLNCILGPNGSGKTTLLLTIGGALRPLSGFVEVEPEGARKLYVPPARQQLPGFTIGMVVAYYLGRVSGLLPLPSEGLKRAVELLRAWGLRYGLDHEFDKLSSGEASKVVLAAALASDSEVLLLDEPNSHLDLKARALLYSELKAACEEKLVVVSLHDVNEAAASCDRVLLLGEGKVVACGPPSQALSKESLSSAYGAEFKEVVANGSRFFLPVLTPPSLRRA